MIKEVEVFAIYAQLAHFELVKLSKELEAIC